MKKLCALLLVLSIVISFPIFAAEASATSLVYPSDIYNNDFAYDFTFMYECIEELIANTDIIAPKISALWKAVGADYISGVFELIANSETAYDLEMYFSNSSGLHLQYYDKLATTLGYKSSYSSFGAGSSIPHEQSYEIIKYTAPIRSLILNIQSEIERLDTLMVEFRNHYKSRSEYSEEYKALLDYYVEAVSYANNVINLSGSYNSYTSTIQDYGNRLPKLARSTFFLMPVYDNSGTITVKDAYINYILENGEDFSLRTFNGKVITKIIEGSTTIIRVGVNFEDNEIYLIEELGTKGDYQNDIIMVSKFSDKEMVSYVEFPFSSDGKEYLAIGRLIVDPVVYKTGDNVSRVWIEVDDELGSLIKSQIVGFSLMGIKAMNSLIKEFDSNASVRDLGFRYFEA